MTQWLIRTFVRDRANTHDPAVRMRYGQLAGTVGILANLMLAGGKLLAALLSGSVAIMADAANNLSDASSSIVSLLGFKMAGKPADQEHPYGHARYEYLAGLTVSVLIMIIGVELFRSSLNKVLHPAPVTFGWVSLAVLAVSILVKLWMAGFNRTVGRAIASQTLIATAQDSRNDVITTSAVLVAALISRFFHINVDGWIGLAVALFILWSGWGLIRDTLDPLLGKAPDPELVQSIRETIMGYPGVLGTHDLIIHDYGPGRRFASVHVEMAAEEDVMQSHDVIDNIERDFLNRDKLHMIVHLDPIITRDPLVNDLRGRLAELVKEIHPELTIHDLRVVKGRSHTNLIFDCIKPHDLDMSNAQLKRAISERVSAEHPNHYCVITVDESYAAVPK
ncbi:MAG: cation transporter [Clostridiales bacterium]|nr:cation transporter [Clostridiales bacterium]